MHICERVRCFSQYRFHTRTQIMFAKYSAVFVLSIPDDGLLLPKHVACLNIERRYKECRMWRFVWCLQYISVGKLVNRWFGSTRRRFCIILSAPCGNWLWVCGLNQNDGAWRANYWSVEGLSGFWTVTLLSGACAFCTVAEMLHDCLYFSLRHH